MRRVIVSNSAGLHARAASAIFDVVRGFDARVELVKGHERVSATDVLQMLSLGAEAGVELDVEASGREAEAALRALTELFESKFHEDD